ncbi:MAG: hypothetical protein IPK35_15530 [Saprospiraceae bacterium]|nr:hypothetical protein [Saprospiraceae bacterium]
MKAATLHQIKKELETIAPQKLMTLTLRLIKFKTENKELISYLLFDDFDQAGYISDIKYEVTESLSNLKNFSPYLVKKALRKALKLITRYSKYMGSKDAEAELLIHFCKHIHKEGINKHTHKAVLNIYLNTLIKVQKLIPLVHHELQNDFQEEISRLHKV